MLCYIHVSAVLTLGDDRTVNFRRQELHKNDNQNDLCEQHRLSNYLWESDANTLPFSCKHGDLFLLYPHDETPIQTDPPNGPTQRFQHGGVKFSDRGAISVAMVFRTVTSRELVNR